VARAANGNVYGGANVKLLGKRLPLARILLAASLVSWVWTSAALGADLLAGAYACPGKGTVEKSVWLLSPSGDGYSLSTVAEGKRFSGFGVVQEESRKARKGGLLLTFALSDGHGKGAMAGVLRAVPVKGSKKGPAGSVEIAYSVMYDNKNIFNGPGILKCRAGDVR